MSSISSPTSPVRSVSSGTPSSSTSSARSHKSRSSSTIDVQQPNNVLYYASTPFNSPMMLPSNAAMPLIGGSPYVLPPTNYHHPHQVFATPAAWFTQREKLLAVPTPTFLPANAIGNDNVQQALTYSPDKPTSSKGKKKCKHSKGESSIDNNNNDNNNNNLAPPTLYAAAVPTSTTNIHTNIYNDNRNKLDFVREQEQKSLYAQKWRIQQTFLTISSLLILLLVIILVYYDFELLSPHLSPLLNAILFTVLLSTPKRYLLKLFNKMDNRLDQGNYKLYLYLIGLLITIASATIFLNSLYTIIIIITLFLLFTFVMYGDRHTLSSVILLLALIFIVAFPLFFFIKTCVNESQEFATRLRNFIESSPEFQRILEDFTTSNTFIWFQSTCRNWGYELPIIDVPKLRSMMTDSIVKFADQLSAVLTSVYGIILNLSSMLVSLVTFLSLLFFFLEREHTISATLSWLSPFSADDNSKLMNVLKQSVTRIFLSSFCIGSVHAIVTYISFSLCGIDLCLILSFISGFLSMLPIFSSWIVWIPASLGLLLTNQMKQAIILCACQLSLKLYVDGLIYSWIPGDSYIIGVALVSAIYAWGTIGVVLGPLLAIISSTVLSMYKDYLSLPLLIDPSTPQFHDLFHSAQQVTNYNVPGHKSSVSALSLQMKELNKQEAHSQDDNVSSDSLERATPAAISAVATSSNSSAASSAASSTSNSSTTSPSMQQQEATLYQSAHNLAEQNMNNDSLHVPYSYVPYVPVAYVPMRGVQEQVEDSENESASETEEHVVQAAPNATDTSTSSSAVTTPQHVQPRPASQPSQDHTPIYHDSESDDTSPNTLQRRIKSANTPNTV